jgi:O-methyltransferase
MLLRQALQFRPERTKSRLYAWLLRAILTIPWLPDLLFGHDRLTAFLRAWRYLSNVGVAGDYLEFGVFEGMSFELALRTATRSLSPEVLQKTRFFAFDSFCGLPSPDPLHDSPFFLEGGYSATMETFKKNIRHGAKRCDVRIIPGTYEESLGDRILKEHDLVKAAFVNIDCDLYSSTLLALNFITPLLQTGTVLYFDDWYFCAGNSAMSEAGACAAWLSANPNIQLMDFGNIGSMAKYFLVCINSELGSRLESD